MPSNLRPDPNGPNPPARLDIGTAPRRRRPRRPIAVVAALAALGASIGVSVGAVSPASALRRPADTDAGLIDRLGATRTAAQPDASAELRRAPGSTDVPTDVRPTDVRPTDVRPDRPSVEVLRLRCRAVAPDAPTDRVHVGCTWSLPERDAARTLTLWRSVDGGPREVVASSARPFPSSYRDVVPAGTAHVAYAVIATDGDGRIVARSRAAHVVIRHRPDPVDTRPVDTRPVDTLPVDTRPVDTRPVDTRPVDTRPVDTRPVDTRPVDTRPVDTRPIGTQAEEQTD